MAHSPSHTEKNIKIGNSKNVIRFLIVILSFMFPISHYVGNTIWEAMLLKPMDFEIALVLYIGLLLATMKLYYTQPGLYDTHLLMNYFSGRSRAVFGGIQLKLPWESVEREEDLEAEIAAHVSGTFPTSDGAVKVDFTVISKIDAGDSSDPEEFRSLHVAKYCGTTKEAIIQAQTKRGEQVIRDRIRNKTTEEVIKMKAEKLLNNSDFLDSENEYSVDVIECLKNDVDRAKEAQEVQDAKLRAKGMKEIVTILMQDEGFSKDKAEEMAPYLMKDVNIAKKVQEFAFSGGVDIKGLEGFGDTVKKAATKFTKKS